MFGRKFKLFKMFGFQVNVDLSWLFIAFLVTWTLAVGFFPLNFPELETSTYWIMGVLGALGLFLSIIIHEFSHSLVARRYGLNMKGITLFLFGGVAEMEDEPASAKAEFMMAIAGPIASLVLSAIFYGIYRGLDGAAFPTSVVGILAYLALINLVVAIFNMLPAFPLDGGRVLRSILWGWKKDLRWATRVAAGAGKTFGFLLLGLGALGVFAGNIIGGMWWILIGMFVIGAANASLQQVMFRTTLHGEKVRRFMASNPVAVPPSLSLRDLVEKFIYSHHYKMYPIIEDGRLRGCITTREVKSVPREEWDTRTVGEVATLCSPGNTIGPEEDVMEGLMRMNQNKSSRMLVVDNDRLVGVLALKDVLEFLNVKLELEH